MDRFACGYCGTEIAVQRRGGTIVLKSITQAVKNMPTGADKTSAELALMRLKEEAQNLSKRYDAMLKEKIERNKRGYVMGVSLLLFGGNLHHKLHTPARQEGTGRSAGTPRKARCAKRPNRGSCLPAIVTSRLV